MEKLTLLWTTDNEITIKNMLFMYAKNAKIQRWFSEVQIIIWGASTKKLAQDIEIQNGLKEVLNAGVKAVACMACSENLGMTEVIKDLGIETKFVGDELSGILKAGGKILTI